MIALKVKPYCRECPNFEAVSNSEVGTDVFGNVVTCYHTITCSHADVCNRIKEYLKNSKENP